MTGSIRITCILLQLCIFALSFTGCRKNITASNNQSLLFEYDFVSYSLDYKHSGFLIDGEGNVYTFNNPEKWNFPGRDLRISESQVAENMSMCARSGIKIPPAELQKYSSHIVNIAASKITALKKSADSAGSGEFRCYSYSESSGIYKGTVIKMEGDFTCENLNFYSRKVVDWMRNINSRLAEK